MLHFNSTSCSLRNPQQWAERDNSETMYIYIYISLSVGRKISSFQSWVCTVTAFLVDLNNFLGFIRGNENASVAPHRLPEHHRRHQHGHHSHLSVHSSVHELLAELEMAFFPHGEQDACYSRNAHASWRTSARNDREMGFERLKAREKKVANKCSLSRDPCITSSVDSLAPVLLCIALPCVKESVRIGK